MPFPTILIDSATGSDTAASGAGPATALTGPAAGTSADGLTVTLDGSPDLSGVATDGTHVLFLSDSTAGNRNFSRITAKDVAARTVTVAHAFGASLSGKPWAIGGRRASIGSATSRKLADNNVSAGDAMPGWKVRLASGHAETLSGALTWRRAGDTTDGPIVLEGEPGAGTMPVVETGLRGVGANTRRSRVPLQPLCATSAVRGSTVLRSNGCRRRRRRVTPRGAAPLPGTRRAATASS